MAHATRLVRQQWNYLCSVLKTELVALWWWVSVFKTFLVRIFTKDLSHSFIFILHVAQRNSGAAEIIIDMCELTCFIMQNDAIFYIFAFSD
jgi:hypothetical protein